MMEVWPTSLPQFVLVDGYSEEEGDNLLEYAPDIGPPISRARSTSAARPITVQFNLKRDQLATLREFYRTTLIRGALPFEFPAPSEDQTYTLKFKKGGHPKWSGLGGNVFAVQMQLLVMP